MDFPEIPEDKINDKVYLTKCLLDLISQQKTISNNLDQANIDLLNEEIKETEQEVKIWLETDFKKKKCTNKELREAYVKSEMNNFISRKGKCYNNVQTLKREYRIIGRIIRVLTILLDEVVIDG